jgi:hypothetical protein
MNVFVGKLIFKWLKRFNDWMNNIPEELRNIEYFNIFL